VQLVELTKEGVPRKKFSKTKILKKKLLFYITRDEALVIARDIEFEKSYLSQWKHLVIDTLIEITTLVEAVLLPL
jgi:hypothetical protein